MNEFDIDELREKIKGFSYEDKLSFLEDKEGDIEELIEQLQGNIADISSLKDEIQTERNEMVCKSILQSLKDAGFPLDLNNDGNVSFSLGVAEFTILMWFAEPNVVFSFNAEEKQLKYRELITSLLPNFKQDGNSFSRLVSEEELSMCVVELVRTLMNNRPEFEN